PVQIRQRRYRVADERVSIRDQRLVQRTVTRAEHQRRRLPITKRLAFEAHRTVEPDAQRRRLAFAGTRRNRTRRPTQPATDHGDRGPTTREVIEPTVGSEHDVGVTIIQPEAVGLQPSENRPRPIYEID